MAQFFESGRAADLILVILIGELLWLVAGRKLSLIEAAGAILPGLLIVVALRAALTEAAWPWIAVPLALSFPFHVIDVGRRIRVRRPR